MGKEYRAKVFKSGNSLALRLPKELGMVEGSTMVLREERAGFKVEPEIGAADRLDISSFWGKAKGMVHVPVPREDFEERPEHNRETQSAEKGVIRYLIDSDCAIFATTAQVPQLGVRLSQCRPGEVGLSAISYAEITLGMEQGKPPTPEALAAMIKKVPVVAFDVAAARAYAKLPFKRARFDRLLAAHALSIGATMVTNNPGDFADVPGLVVENWTTEA